MAAREVFRPRVADLDEDPGQPRTYFDDDGLARLAESLIAVGQLEPILVRKHPEKPKRYFIVNGHRRVRVYRAAGRLEIDALLVDDSLRPTDILLGQIVLGIHGEHLRPLDLARSIDKAGKESGKTQAELAKILGLSEPTISRKLSLLSLTPALQERVQSGQLAESVAAQIARAGDAAAQERLAAEVDKSGLTRDALAGEMKRRRNGKSTTGKQPARLVACLSGGRTVTLAGPGLDTLDSAIEWVEEFLSQARKARPKGIGVSTFARLLRDQAGTAVKSTKEES